MLCCGRYRAGSGERSADTGEWRQGRAHGGWMLENNMSTGRKAGERSVSGSGVGRCRIGDDY